MLGLPRSEVHVWVLPASQAEEVAPLLDEVERERAARFRHPRDRALFTVAHGSLRRLLGAHLGERPESFAFGAGEHGKPFLVGRPDVSFNISHSGEVALVALAAGREVGVDVEAGRRLDAEEGVARRMMTDDELARYLALADGDRRSFLLWAWARKEALAKASGLGMGASLRTLSCEPGAAGEWSVVDLDVPGCAAAVAARGHDWVPVVRESACV